MFIGVRPQVSGKRGKRVCPAGLRRSSPRRLIGVLAPVMGLDKHRKFSEGPHSRHSCDLGGFGIQSFRAAGICSAGLEASGLERRQGFCMGCAVSDLRACLP